MADTRATLTLAANLDPSGVLSAVKAMQGAFSSLKLPDNIGEGLDKSLSKATDLLKKYQGQLAKGINTKTDAKNITKTGAQINEVLDEISHYINDLNGQQIFLKADVGGLNKLQAGIENARTAWKNAIQEFRKGSDIDKVLSGIGEKTTRSNLTQGSINKARTLFDKGDLEGYRNALDEIYSRLSKLKDTTVSNVVKNLGLEDAGSKSANLEQIKRQLEAISKIDFSSDANVKAQFDEITNAVSTYETEVERAGNAGQEAFNNINASSAVNNTRALVDATDQYTNSIMSAKDQVQDLQRSTQYFFSLRNMLNLLKRGIDDAIQSVKELDAAMTETAVVTDYKVSDLWGMLPQYTQLANQLGATTQGAYETMTLYFQQGLDQQQAFEIGAETMKMARIAGLDYAETTDMMTAALRGFNMELNETSAKRINDVYSELAAITASDTEELGTAMQRTASIAHSAGMSFEGTTAFLAQAIETTREPAENIGTAMKTIVARFQEMKENPLEISEVDGEEVNYNKVDAALKSIGVSLKDTNGQFRELDQVFLDISSRWDGLSQTQQRYIATVAAGSRQQSRFIAMMDNYDRTMQLFEAANNSAGASDEQFGKTMDSLESKLNKLHNAWQAFTMGIANNSMIKLAVDGLTGFLTITNKIIDTLSLGSGAIKSFLSVFAAFTGLKVAGRAANSLIGGLGGLVDPQSTLKEGLKIGLFGQGRANAQTKAITTPIVAKLGEVIAAIREQKISRTTKASTVADETTKASTVADYKTAVSAFHQVGTSNSSYKTMNDISSIFSNLSDKHAAAVVANSTGTMGALNRTSQNWIKQVTGEKLDKNSQLLGTQLINGIYKGMKKGEISPEEGIKLIGQPSKWGQYFGTESAKSFSKSFIKARKQQHKDLFNSKEVTDAAWNSIGGAAASEQQRNKLLQDPKWKAKFEKAQRKMYIQTRNQKIKDGSYLPNFGQQAIQSQTQAERLANSIANVGSNFTAAGFSIQQFGQQLSMLSPALSGLGNTITLVGSAVTTFGMGISGISQAVDGIGELITALGGLSTFIPIAVGVGAAIGALIYDAKRVENIKKAGQAVVDSFEEANKTTTENINNLEQWRGELAHLSQGVDKNGNNISLDTSDYSRYRELINSIAEINPSIVEGYNAQGDAIIDNNKALENTLALQKQIRQDAATTYTSNPSLNKLIKARDEDDRLYIEKKGTKFSRTKEARNALANQLRGEINFDKLEEQLGFDFQTASDAQLARHYQTINKALTNLLGEDMSVEVGEKLSEFVEAEEDRSAATEDVYKALSTYAKQQKYTALVPEELANEYETLLKEEAATAPDATAAKNFAKKQAKQMRALGGASSEAGSLFKAIRDAEEKYAQDFNVDNYTKAISEITPQLEALSAQYKQSSNEAKKAFAETIDAMIAEADSYTTLGGQNLVKTFNTAQNAIEAMSSAYDEFKKTLEGGSLENATSSLKSIYDEMYSGTNANWGGNSTYWTGAKNFVSDELFRSGDFKKVDKIMKDILPTLEDTEAGYEAAFDYVRNLSKELQGTKWENVLKPSDDGGFDIKDLTSEAMEGIANEKGIQADVLRTILAKVARTTGLKMWDPEQIRASYIGDERVTTQEGKGEEEGIIYIKKSEFENDLLEADIPPEQWDEIEGDVEKHKINLLPDKLTDENGKVLDEAQKQIEEAGINANNYMSELIKKGYEEQDILAYGQKVTGKSEEELQQQYNEELLSETDPAVGEINSGVNQAVSLLDAIYGQLGGGKLEEGTARDSDFLGKQIYDNIFGGEGQETNIEKYHAGLDSQGEELSKTSYLAAKKETDEIISASMDYLHSAREGLKKAQQAGDVEQIEKYKTDIEQAEKGFKYAVEASNNLTSTWAEKSGQWQGFTQTPENYYNQRYGNILDTNILTQLIAGGLHKLFPEGNSWFGWGGTKTEPSPQEKSPSQQTEEEFHESHPAGYVGAAFLKEWQWVQDFFSDFSLPDFNPDSANQLKASGEAINEAITNTSDGITSSGEILGQALSSMSLKTQEGVDEAEQSISNQDSRLNKIDVSWLQKFMSSAVDKVNKIISQPPGGTTTTPVSNTINKGAGAVAAIAKQATNNTQDNMSVMNVDVAGTEKLDEVKVKATDAKNTIEAGATFEVSVSDSGLATVAKQAATINKASGNKNINVTATASGLEDTQSLTTAVGDFKKLKNDSVKLTVKVSGLSDLTSAISKVHSFYNLRDDTVTLTTKHEKKATGTHNHGYVSAPPKAGSAARGSYGQLGPKGKGGMTLTGELGYEIAWIPSENRSMILGANGPQMVNLPGDAIVWTHEQSKKIMKQKSIPAGSHSSSSKEVQDGHISRPSFGGGGGSNNSTSSKAAKQSLKAANTGEKAAKKAGKVSVYWENLAHKNEALQRKMDKNQKLFEKLLKAGGTTQASIAGAADEYKKSLNQIISLNLEAMNTAKGSLNKLDSGKKVKVSYKSGKKTKTKKINTKKYIDIDPTTGAYVINQAEISKKAGKNKELAKAIKAEAEKQIKDYQDKYNSAEDAVTKATEALDQLADDMYTTFHQWEKTITQVYLLGQRLEQLTKQRDVYEAAFDSEIDRLSAHFGNAEDSLPRIRSALNQSRELLVSQLDAQSKLIQGTYDEYANALDLTAYRKKTIDANPESQEAKNDYAMREATLQFLSKIGITDMDKFDYSDAIQQLEARGYNEKSYNQIKEGLDDIKSIQDGYYSSIEDTYKKASEIYSLMNEYQSFISEFEGNLLDGMAEQTEAEINRLDKLNTALAKAMKELLDEVKRKLDERRQKEDNQKTESDISKKQQRLTALRADTSGGHATEIAQLEKEIAEARQNYGRTLEDQLIEKLQNQADIAEKQRERQIELLEGQKELAEKTGTNLEQVRKWLQDPRANYEQIREAYFANAKYDEATPGKQKEIEGQFEADFAKYLGYSEQLKALQTIDEHVKAILDRADEQAGVEHIDREKTQKELVSVNEKLTKEQETKESLQKDLGEAQSNLDSLEQQRLEASKQLASAKEREKETQKAYGAAQNQYQAALQSGNENQIAAAGAKLRQARTNHIKAKRNAEEARGKVALFDAPIAQAKANVDNIKNKIAETDANINNLKQQKTELEGLLNTQDGIKEPDIKFQEATAPTAAPTQANTASQDLANMYQMAIRHFPFDTIGVGGGNGFMRKRGYDELLRLAQKLGYNERQVLSDLVNRYHGEWEPVLHGFTRAGMSGKINLERLVATFPSPALQRALNDRSVINSYRDNFKHLRPLPGVSIKEYKDGQIISMNGQRMTPYDYLLALVQRYHTTPYKTGGIADFTGPAWLDGTPSKPELVLNATDTKNFIALKDVLSRAMSSVGHVENSYGGNANFEININVDHISNDYDVNKVVDQVEKRIVQKSGYRNVTQVRNFR